MIENFWIVTPYMFWVIIISTTFWLTCKGLVMDMFPRSVHRTVTTSLICILAILTVPGAIANGYNGSTDWIIKGQAGLHVFMEIAIIPGEFVIMVYEIVRGNV